MALLREARESRRCESGDEVRELMDELASLRSRMGLAGLIWRPGDCYKGDGDVSSDYSVKLGSELRTYLDGLVVAHQLQVWREGGVERDLVDPLVHGFLRAGQE